MESLPDLNAFLFLLCLYVCMLCSVLQPHLPTTSRLPTTIVWFTPPTPPSCLLPLGKPSRNLEYVKNTVYEAIFNSVNRSWFSEILFRLNSTVGFRCLRLQFNMIFSNFFLFYIGTRYHIRLGKYCIRLDKSAPNSWKHHQSFFQ
jgi:hypothetical protein